MDMKKMFLVCLSILMTTGLVTMSAQTPISYGMKLEANMSNFLLTDLDNQSSTMKLGPTLGGFMNIGVHENFSIQPEVMFYYRQSEMETGRSEEHTSELQSRPHLVCRLLLEKKKKRK